MEYRVVDPGSPHRARPAATDGAVGPTVGPSPDGKDAATATAGLRSDDD